MPHDELKERIFASAFLCELVLKERDVLSAIRLTDVHEVHVPPPPERKLSPDQVLIPFAKITGYLVVVFKSETAHEVFTTIINGVSPAGQSFVRKEFEIKLNGAPHGHCLLMELNLTVHLPGIYWLEVLIGEEVYQRVPMEVIFKPLPEPSPPDSQNQPSSV